MLIRPVIGITAAHCTEELKTFPRHYYVESIRKAGGPLGTALGALIIKAQVLAHYLHMEVSQSRRT